MCSSCVYGDCSCFLLVYLQAVSICCCHFEGSSQDITLMAKKNALRSRADFKVLELQGKN